MELESKDIAKEERKRLYSQIMKNFRKRLRLETVK